MERRVGYDWTDAKLLCVHTWDWKYKNEKEEPDKVPKPNKITVIATHKECSMQLLLTSGLHSLDIGMSKQPRQM